MIGGMDLPAPLLELDAEGRVLRANAAAERMLGPCVGRPVEEAVGRRRLLPAGARTMFVDDRAEVSHSLSQPLMAAMGVLELLLLTADLPPEPRERVRRAYEQVQRASAVVAEHLGGRA